MEYPGYEGRAVKGKEMSCRMEISKFMLATPV
jgi:hypothetical protein